MIFLLKTIIIINRQNKLQSADTKVVNLSAPLVDYL